MGLHLIGPSGETCHDSEAHSQLYGVAHVLAIDDVDEEPEHHEDQTHDTRDQGIVPDLGKVDGDAGRTEPPRG